MKPWNFEWQGMVAVIAALVLGAFSDQVGRGAIALVSLGALGFCLAIQAWYIHALRNGPNQLRSDERARGDHRFSRAAIGLFAGLGAFELIMLRGPIAHTSWSKDLNVDLGVFLAGGSLSFAAAAVSTACDWFVVKPIVDGVIDEPICQGKDLDRRKYVTRWLLGHRIVAALFFYSWIIATLAFAAIAFRHASPALSSVITISPFAVATAIMVSWRKGLFPGAQEWLGEISIALGDVVKVFYGTKKKQYLVCGMDLPTGYKLVDKTGDLRTVALGQSQSFTVKRPGAKMRCELAVRPLDAKNNDCGGLDLDGHCQRRRALSVPLPRQWILI